MEVIRIGQANLSRKKGKLSKKKRSVEKLISLLGRSFPQKINYVVKRRKNNE